MERRDYMCKVSLFLADGFEEVEALAVVDLLRRADIDISMISISGELEVTGAHKIKVIADKLFEEEDFSTIGMLVLPGGMPGTKHLAEHKKLVELLKDFNSKGKLLAAICAAPMVLGDNGLLKGKSATCYPGFEESLLGASFKDKDVVVDGNIITSKGMGTAIDFALAIIKQIKSQEEASKIAKSIQYKYF